MNPIIHVFGIIIKYFFLNLKIFVMSVFASQDINIEQVTRVVFTHNLGGGTESYVQSHFVDNRTLIVRVISYRNDSFFSLETAEKKIIQNRKKLFLLLGKNNFDEVIVNSFCAYKNVSSFINYILNKMHYEKLVYLIHDFHCCCPTGNFIHKNKYCNQDCSGCSLAKKVRKMWQPVWNNFFIRTDKVICFSQSSKDICLRYYPLLKEKLEIIPHSMEYCHFIPLKNISGKNIGVVGNCSNIAKGKNVILNLERYLKKEKRHTLVVVGKNPFLFNRCNKYFFVTGSYKLEKLPDLLVENQIGVIVFTSILPETFSYAISELMMLNIPIISLNLGAQGEKIMNYKNGYFVDDLSPESIVECVDKILSRG